MTKEVTSLDCVLFGVMGFILSYLTSWKVALIVASAAYIFKSI